MCKLLITISEYRILHLYSSESLIDAGIRAILNFTATHVRAPDCCIVENVDLSLKLENLAYHMAKITRGPN